MTATPVSLPRSMSDTSSMTLDHAQVVSPPTTVGSDFSMDLLNESSAWTSNSSLSEDTDYDFDFDFDSQSSNNATSFPHTPSMRIAVRANDHIDPFCTSVVPMTSDAVRIIRSQLDWADEAAVTQFSQLGARLTTFQLIFGDELLAAPWLAFAGEQMRQYRGIEPSPELAPELMAVTAFQSIKRRVAEGTASDMTLMSAVFRLALYEWITRNHDAAKVHFQFIKSQWHTFFPHSAVDQHYYEIMSCEDVFFAVDIDEKPMLDLDWEPELSMKKDPAMRRASLENLRLIPGAMQFQTPAVENHLLAAIRAGLISPELQNIVLDLQDNLNQFTAYSQLNFALATTGAQWIMKRRLQAAVHRLQSIEPSTERPLDQAIRRTLTIILTCGSLSPIRRLARISLSNVAARLRLALQQVATDAQLLEASYRHSLPQHGRSFTYNSLLWLWMCLTGLAGAADGLCEEGLEEWFLERAAHAAEKAFKRCPDLYQVEGALKGYLFFECAYERAIPRLMSYMSHSKLIKSSS